LVLSKKMVWFYFSTSHTSCITNLHALSSPYQYMPYLITYFVVKVIARWSCECPYVDTMFPSQLYLFPVQNLPFIFH
jgi:hypothetical protein